MVLVVKGVVGLVDGLVAWMWWMMDLDIFFLISDHVHGHVVPGKRFCKIWYHIKIGGRLFI